MVYLFAPGGIVHQFIGTNVIEHNPIHGHGLASLTAGRDLTESTNVETGLVFRRGDLFSNHLNLLTDTLSVGLEGGGCLHLERLIRVLCVGHLLLLLLAGRALTLLSFVAHHRDAVEELLFDWGHAGYTTARFDTSTRLGPVAVSAAQLRRQHCLVH